MRPHSIIAILFGCLVLEGCPLERIGHDFNGEAASQIRSDVTTREDVLRLLGEPLEKRIMPNGVEEWKYAYNDVTVVIPLPGGRADFVNKVLQVSFRRGIVVRCDYQLQVGAMKGGFGITTPSTTTITTCGDTERSLRASYAGTITANTQGQQIDMPIILTVTRSENEISGTWVSGNVSGTINGRLQVERTVLRFQALQLEPCPGEFDGTAIFDDDFARLRGTYVGRDCHGPVEATFTTKRQ